MKRLNLFFILVISVLVFLFSFMNVTGNVRGDSIADEGIDLEEQTCPESPTCAGTYLEGYDENNCPIYKCPSCEEGERKEYTCPNGDKVDWCQCSNNLWICANSPENSCQSQTCSMPVCENGELHFTGSYDEDNCPIYECQGMECSPGIGSEYVCSDGTSVPDCKCSNDGRWVCIANPEWQCPAQVCPEGCVCNENIIACSQESTSTKAITETSCPAGCLCSENQIVCEEKLTSKGKCSFGCELNEGCVIPGIRDSNQYCDLDSQWKIQKTKDSECNNNFECETNLCINSKCITQGFLERIFEWFRNLFGQS